MPIRPSLNFRIIINNRKFFYSHSNKAKPPKLGLALLQSTSVLICDDSTTNLPYIIPILINICPNFVVLKPFNELKIRLGGAKCTDTEGSFECDCSHLAGTHLYEDGRTCVDDNECDLQVS